MRSEAGALSDVVAAPSLPDLFREHAGYVWNALRRLGAPPLDLEDLTHDVFLQVHRHLGDYDATRPLRPWLFGFAYRVVAQHRRRAHRRYETLGDPPLSAADPAARPDEELAAREERRLVVAALQCLPLERRAVFVLHAIDDVPMREIAVSLGIPLNTAYSRLRVGRDEFVAAVKRMRPRREPP